jgi:hypothetical protein
MSHVCFIDDTLCPDCGLNTADRLMTENRGWLQFTPEGIEAHHNGRDWMPGAYQLVEVYCVTRDEWGYLGPVACGADCMCAVVYFPPDVSDEEMTRYRYNRADIGYAISRECGRGEHDLKVYPDGSTFCEKECGYMTFPRQGVDDV